MNRHFFPKLALASAVSTLIACGGTGQDDGSSSDFRQEYSGVVIDGYLARATVFLDSNNDSTRNAWEAYAFTDDDGYFSYNPLTDTDYCAVDATAEQQQYCLTTNIDYAGVVIRIDSGYDVLTGEPFEGQMSRRLTEPDEGVVTGTTISPLTSLLTNIEGEDNQTQVLASLALDLDDLDVDYLNQNGGGETNARLLNSAIKVHKVVSVLADRITDTYDEIGEESGTPNDATSSLYSALAEELLGNDQSFDEVIADGGAVARVLDATETEMRDIYRDNEFTLPADMGSESSLNAFARVVDVANDIVTIVNSVIDSSATDVTEEEVVGFARAVESVVIKALDETTTDTSIDNAESFFSDLENADLVEALVSGLSGDDADLSSLADNSFSGSEFDTVEEVSAATQLPEGTAPFTEIAGFELKVSDLDLGNAPSDLDDKEIEWYFQGSPGDASGDFVACVKFIEGASTVDGTIGEGSTRGERVEGFWSLLGASSESLESYSLLITITFLETTYQAILKPAGMETNENVEYQRIRFDNSDGIETWHSEMGLMEMDTSVPASNDECEARLPSRVGV
ncbi:MAG: hypothetical protein K6L76_06225 [Agarilytica sp.]